MIRRLADLKGADPYALLEVSPEASAEEIQRAHRRMLRQAHPDLATGDEDRTKLLNIARDVLLDPDLRADYDRGALAMDPDPTPPSAWDAEDIVVDDVTEPMPTFRPPPYQPYPPPTSYPPTSYPPPAYPPPPYTPPAYTPPYQAYPPYGAPYRPAGGGSGGIGLGVWALIAAVLCSPLGAILGVVALLQRPRPDNANRICAIIAVCWGGVGLLCCVGYVFAAMLGTFDTS